MLKSIALFVMNRLFILVVIFFALNTYFRTSCGAGSSIFEEVQRAIAGLNEISRVLP
jgi:hypothetical protein